MPNQLSASILTHDIIPNGVSLLQIVKSLGLSDTLVNESLKDLVGEDPILQDFLQDTFHQLGFLEMKLQSRQEHFSSEASVAHLQDDTDLHIYDSHGISGVNEEGEEVPVFTDIPMVSGNSGTLLMFNCYMDHHKAVQIATHVTQDHTPKSRGVGVWHGNGGEVEIERLEGECFVASFRECYSVSVKEAMSGYLKHIYEAREYVPEEVMRIRKSIEDLSVSRAEIELHLSQVLGEYIDRHDVVLSELSQEKLINLYARFKLLKEKFDFTCEEIEEREDIGRSLEKGVFPADMHVERKSSEYASFSRTFRDGSSDQGADLDLISVTGKPVYIRRTYDLKGIYVGGNPYFLALENQNIYKKLDALLTTKRTELIAEQSKAGYFSFLSESLEHKVDSHLEEAFEELGVTNTDFQLAYKQFFCDSIRYVAEVHKLDGLMEESIQQFQNLEVSEEDLFKKLEDLQKKHRFRKTCIVHYKQKLESDILSTKLALRKLHEDLKGIGQSLSEGETSSYLIYEAIIDSALPINEGLSEILRKYIKDQEHFENIFPEGDVGRKVLDYEYKACYSQFHSLLPTLSCFSFFKRDGNLEEFLGELKYDIECLKKNFRGNMKSTLVKRYLQEQLGEDFKLIADKLDFLEAKKEEQGLSRMKEVGVTRSVQLQSESSSVVSERSRVRQNAVSL